MAEEMTTLTSPTQAQPVSTDQLTDAQLESQIKSVQDGMVKAEAEMQAAAMAQIPVPAQADQAVPAPEQAVVAPEVIQAQPTAAQTSFAELQNKTGVKSQDQLATNFVNLQRELTRKSQELANLKRQQGTVMQQATVQQVQQEPVPIQPQQQLGQYNDQFLQALATNPIPTLQALVETVLAPERQSLAELRLQNEVTRMSATHADFNTDPVRGEMQRLISERYAEGYDITKNLEDVYWMAKGRITANPQMPNSVMAQKPSPIVNQMIGKAVVEGQARPQAQQPFDPKTAPMDQLEATIKNMQNQLK